MNLTLETSLHGVAQAIETRLAPALGDPFAREAARLAVILTKVAALAVDDAAAVRAEENAALRTLFAEAAATVGGALGERLAAASATVDASIRISDLDRANADLRRLLIALHAEVEGRDDAAAAALDRRIWALMAASEAARAPRV